MNSATNVGLVSRASAPSSVSKPSESARRVSSVVLERLEAVKELLHSLRAHVCARKQAWVRRTRRVHKRVCVRAYVTHKHTCMAHARTSCADETCGACR